MRLSLNLSLFLSAILIAAGNLRAAEQQSPVAPKPAAGRVQESQTASPNDQRRPVRDRIDLNRATATELESLPGVGAATAQAIVKARPFRTVNELTNVNGISPARMAVLKPLVKVSSISSAATSNPGSSSKPTASTPGEKATARGDKVNLNQATVQELETLPGVGAATAQAIVKARPFKSINDLTNVTGIGESKLATLRPHVTLQSAPPARTVGRPSNGERATGQSSSTAPARSRSTGPNAASKELASGERIDLNTATKEELESLPDIGPTRAQAIIDARPFATVEDVMKVKGIKEGVFGQIKDKITVK
jgi:competence protein ComEA